MNESLQVRRDSTYLMKTKAEQGGGFPESVGDVA